MFECRRRLHSLCYHMCRSQVLKFHYLHVYTDRVRVRDILYLFSFLEDLISVCSWEGNERSSPSWLLVDTWCCCFNTTRSHSNKKKALKTLWPHSQQFEGTTVFSWSDLPFSHLVPLFHICAHHMLVPLVLYLFSWCVPAPTRKFSHSSFFAVNS